MVNLRNFLRQKKHRLHPASNEDDNLHVAADGNNQIFLCRRGRHNRYKSGVMAGVDRLARDYSLDLIADLRYGTFIDCGANIGELGLWALQRNFKYIAFEPEQLEARCADLNCFGGNKETIRKALWSETKTLRFYSRSESADSSLLFDGSNSEFSDIEAVRLSDAIQIDQLKKPVVFKLEVEGAEPEVLQGALDLIAHIDWIAIDCGFERGPQKAHTFVETNNFLTSHGFRLVAAKFQRVTALYKRED